MAVKNHRNGAANPNAQRQQVRTLDEVLGGRPVSVTSLVAMLSRWRGRGAVVVASETAIKRLAVDSSKPVRVTASASCVEVAGQTGADALITE